MIFIYILEVSKHLPNLLILQNLKKKKKNDINKLSYILFT